MPVRLGHWQNQTSNVCSGMIGQWSDRSAMSGHKTSPPGPMNYLRGLALRNWISFWRREGSPGMDMWNAPMVQSRKPFTYRLRESVSLGLPRRHGSSWQRGIAESGSSRLSTLMIEICGDLVWDLSCMQQASYLKGGPLMWMLPCTCTLIKNPIMIWVLSLKLCYLIFTTLWANSADDKLMFFLFSLENRLWHFMQTVSLEEIIYMKYQNLFWEK